MSVSLARAAEIPFADRLRAVPAADRGLCRVLAGLALLALVLGLAFGLAMALARSGALSLLPDTAYRLLTLHGTTAFFYWLSIAQGALLLILAAAEGDRGLALRPLAWLGAGLMAAGFVLSEWAAFTGLPLLYEASPALGADDPATLAGAAGGYLLLAGGLLAVAISAIATLLAGRWPGGSLSALAFGLFAWAGFLIVSAIASANAFLPSLLFALGRAPFPAEAMTDWHILFHNLHYLPLMATVLVWYVIARAAAGAPSVFGARFSKIVFASYLIFVPPTSLYHMFLEPNLPEGVRVGGSLLSLFVSVPTLIAFLVIVGTLEAHARARGGSGLFGWMRRLPWRDPTISTMAAAMASLLLGLVFAFVLIQEKFAPLLSDTFFVPAYFHFFAVGTVTQSFLAGFMLALPALTGRALWRPGVLRWTPLLVLVGLMVFGAAGMAAGVLGVPRRAVDVTYGGAGPAVWPLLMAVLGVGGSLFAAGLAVSAYGVVRTLLAGGDKARAVLPAPAPVAAVPAGVPLWTGPLAVALLVLAMYAATIGAFEFMQSLPLAASGQGGH